MANILHRSFVVRNTFSLFHYFHILRWFFYSLCSLSFWMARGFIIILEPFVFICHAKSIKIPNKYFRAIIWRGWQLLVILLVVVVVVVVVSIFSQRSLRKVFDLSIWANCVMWCKSTKSVMFPMFAIPRSKIHGMFVARAILRPFRTKYNLSVSGPIQTWPKAANRPDHWLTLKVYLTTTHSTKISSSSRLFFFRKRPHQTFILKFRL